MQISPDQSFTVLVACPFDMDDSIALEARGYTREDVEFATSGGDAGYGGSVIWTEFANNKISIFIARTPEEAAGIAARANPDVVLFGVNGMGDQMRRAIKAAHYVSEKPVGPDQSVAEAIDEISQSIPGHRRPAVTASVYSLAALTAA